MNLFFSFLSYLLNFSIFAFLLCSLFHPKRTPFFHLRFILGILSGSLIQVCLEYYVLRFFSYHFIALSILAIYIGLSFLLSHDHLPFCFYYAFFMSVLTPCLNFLFTNLLDNLYHTPHLLRVVMIDVFLFLCFLWIIGCSRRYSFSFPLPAGYWVMMYATVFLEYYCVIKINDLMTFNELVTSSVIIVQAFFLLICLLVYRFILNMCQNYQDTLKEHAAIQQLSLREETYNENRLIFEQMRTLRHELKNHMFYMDYLIDQKRYQELHEYFMEFYQKEYADYGYWDTSNSPINTLLNQKQIAAENSQVKMTIDSSLPEHIGIRDVDLCTILANLLDNALESCQKQEEAWIHVCLSQKKEYISLLIENSIDHDILTDNPSLFTTKANRQLHGIGLAVVRKLVQKYDGILQFSVENHAFIVKISLRDTDTGKEAPVLDQNSSL